MYSVSFFWRLVAVILLLSFKNVSKYSNELIVKNIQVKKISKKLIKNQFINKFLLKTNMYNIVLCSFANLAFTQEATFPESNAFTLNQEQFEKINKNLDENIIKSYLEQLTPNFSDFLFFICLVSLMMVFFSDIFISPFFYKCPALFDDKILCVFFYFVLFPAIVINFSYQLISIFFLSQNVKKISVWYLSQGQNNQEIYDIRFPNYLFMFFSFLFSLFAGMSYLIFKTSGHVYYTPKKSVAVVFSSIICLTIFTSILAISFIYTKPFSILFYVLVLLIFFLALFFKKHWHVYANETIKELVKISHENRKKVSIFFIFVCILFLVYFCFSVSHRKNLIEQYNELFDMVTESKPNKNSDLSSLVFVISVSISSIIISSLFFFLYESNGKKTIASQKNQQKK